MKALEMELVSNFLSITMMPCLIKWNAIAMRLDIGV